MILITFPFIYLFDLAVGALQIARDIISKKPKFAPVVINLPISINSPTKRLILANLISMTPGTITLDEKDEGKILVIHSLYGRTNPEKLITHIQARYERFLNLFPG